jgi:hypothetical protein
MTIGNGTSSQNSTRQNWILTGKGGTGTYLLADTQRCVIKYIGTGTPTDMIAFAGPVRVQMSGIVFDGSYRVQRGSYNSHCFGSLFKDCWWINNTTQGIVEVAFPYVSSFCFLGSSENVWQNCHVFSPGVTNFLAHTIGLTTIGSGAGIALDVSRTSYEDCSWTVADDVNSIAMQLSFCDNLIFKNCFWLTAGERRGKSIKIVAPTGPASSFRAYPLMVEIVGGALVGQMFIDPLWTPEVAGGGNRGIHFVGMMDGDGTAPGFIGTAPLPDHYAFSGTVANGTMLGRRQLALATAGETNYSVTAVRRGTPNTILANTTTATNTVSTLIAAGTLSVRNAVLNEGAILWDRVARFKLSGAFLNNSGADTTLRIRVLLGSTVLFNSLAITIPTSEFYRALRLSLDFGPYLGVPTTGYADGVLSIMTAGAGVNAGAVFASREQAQSYFTTAFDSAQNLIVEIQHGNASAQIISVTSTFLLELI